VPQTSASLTEDRIAAIEQMVARGKAAAAVFTQYTQQDVDRIVKAMVVAGLGQAQHLARLAIAETRLGLLEDKAIKNMVALRLRPRQAHGRRNS
jgi:acetaldehyde dehydrogenase/alcohol dehydrogenase